MTADGPDSPDFEHRPVMLDEITELFAVVPPGTVVDATLGGGGHSASLLRHHPQIDVLGEKLAQPGAHDGVVVHNSDLDHL